MQQFAKDNSRNIKLPKINRSDVKQGNITLKLINTSVPEKPKKSAERQNDQRLTVTLEPKQVVKTAYSDLASRDNNSEGTSEDGSIASLERKNIQAKKKKDHKKSFKPAFILDRKNQAFIHYFNEISSERINKQRLREFLTKRYKENLSVRIVNALGPFFGNYVQTITF